MPKRKQQESLEDILARPWCYYCERDFVDQNVLQTHQREVHFHCDHCTRKLNTASGLAVHTQQVHKAPITRIKNAKEGRDDPSVEIFGILGIPEELVAAHQKAITEEYWRRAAEHRANTGNPLPGTVTHDPNKKGKREETKEEIKARLAAHRAQRQAEREAKHAAKEAYELDPRVPHGLDTRPGDPMQLEPRAVIDSPTKGTPQPSATTGSPPNFTNGSSFNNTLSYSPNNNTMGQRYPSQPQPAMPAPHSSPPPAGLPQRPAVDAPNLTKDEMAVLHSTNGSKRRISAPTAEDAPTNAPPPPSTPPPPFAPHLVRIPAGAGTATIKHGVEQLSSGLNLVWFNKYNGPINSSWEEVKSWAARFGTYFDDDAEPHAAVITH